MNVIIKLLFFTAPLLSGCAISQELCIKMNTHLIAEDFDNYIYVANKCARYR